MRMFEQQRIVDGEAILSGGCSDGSAEVVD
jgi:hypothetical protein